MQRYRLFQLSLAVVVSSAAGFAGLLHAGPLRDGCVKQVAAAVIRAMPPAGEPEPTVAFYVDDNYNSTTPGWQVDHFNRIQDAIDRIAPAPDTGGIIHVAAGGYVENLVLDDADRTIHLLGAGSGSVTVNGLFRGAVIMCTALRSEIVIEGMTLVNGSGYIQKVPGDTDEPPRGGGIYLDSVDGAVIRDCRIVQCTAYDGGGIYNAYSNTHLINCRIELNRSISPLSYDGGGGMQNHNASPSVEYCTFVSNESIARGGALLNSGSSSHPVFRHCTFLSNTAAWGGGVYNVSAAAEFAGCTFAGNKANNPSGSAHGGGVYCERGDSVSEGCLFAGNEALWGSAASHYSSSNGQYVNCVFEGNANRTVHSYGNSDVELINCTIHGSGSSALSLFYGNGTVKNSIFWGNASSISQSGTSAQVYHSNIEHGSGWIGVNNNISADPRFVYAAGGDFRLLPDSPCLDTGNNAYLPAGVETDYYDVPRILPLDGSVDMGAAESLFYYMLGDFNRDQTCDAADLEILSQAWLTAEGQAEYDGRCDIGLPRDGKIDQADAARLGGDWKRSRLVAHWTFDEGAGDTATDCVGGNHGTLTNGPAWAEGRLGGALSFDGVDDFVQLSRILTLPDDHTVCMWVRVPEVGQGNLDPGERVGIMLGNYSSSPNCNWEIHAAGEIRMWWNNGEINRHGVKDLRDDQWHHVAYVRDSAAGVIQTYVDGQPQFVTAAGTNVLFRSLHRIGGDNRSADGGPNFHGLLDDLRIYIRPLSQAQVEALAAGE